MDDLQSILNKTVIADKAGAPLITVMHVAAAAVGAVGLYLMIPQRKRKTVFK